MHREWHIGGNRVVPIGKRTLVIGILNVTPDSFSDGSQFSSLEAALAHAEQMIAEGADIIDVGGESTRPGAVVVSPEEEMKRVVPVIKELAKRTNIPISIDTTKSLVARAALNGGAAIVNDISALRFDYHIADEAAKMGAGLVLMHPRGTPVTMHKLPPVADIIEEVVSSLGSSIKMAERRGVKRQSIAIDPGIGFGKSYEQNLELIANLDQIIEAFPDFPLLIGTSRKSFIGRMLADDNGNPAPVEERLHGTLATITAAVLKGAHIVRTHDVAAAIDTVRMADAISARMADAIRAISSEGPIDRIPVVSSSIVSVGYDADRKTLELEFVNGNTYQYFDVPRSTYNALLAADSKGKFVNTRVKGHYRYSQI